MKDTKLSEQPCPYCGSILDGTTSAFGDYDPSPGAMTVCIECTKVSIFDDNLVMRLPTDEEEFIINTFPAIKRVLDAIKKAKEMHPIKKEPH